MLLEIPKPFGNHNGGQLAFGPDGYLYFSVGDGGGDNGATAKNTGNLLGTISCIDVAAPPKSQTYSIPKGNPFIGKAGEREEIWAYGLCNPWPFSFGPPTHKFRLADAGEAAREEVDVVKDGASYDWPLMEGSWFFGSKTCNNADLSLSVWDYSHDEGCSIIGGYVVRDRGLPSFQDNYVFYDYCSGKVLALLADSPTASQAKLLLNSKLEIVTFGRGLDGAIYIVSRTKGVYCLVEGAASARALQIR